MKRTMTIGIIFILLGIALIIAGRYLSHADVNETVIKDVKSDELRDAAQIEAGKWLLREGRKSLRAEKLKSAYDAAVFSRFFGFEVESGALIDDVMKRLLKSEKKYEDAFPK